MDSSNIRSNANPLGARVLAAHLTNAYKSNPAPVYPPQKYSPRSDQEPPLSFLGSLDKDEIPLAMEKLGKENMEKLLELRKQYEQCYKLAIEY
jgi:hypothetical protein